MELVFEALLLDVVAAELLSTLWEEACISTLELERTFALDRVLDLVYVPLVELDGVILELMMELDI